MFWVVDNFLMKKGRTKAKLEEREVNDDSRGTSKVRYRRALSHDDSESEVRFSGLPTLNIVDYHSSNFTVAAVLGTCEASVCAHIIYHILQTALTFCKIMHGDELEKARSTCTGNK